MSSFKEKSKIGHTKNKNVHRDQSCIHKILNVSKLQSCQHSQTYKVAPRQWWPTANSQYSDYLGSHGHQLWEMQCIWLFSINDCCRTNVWTGPEIIIALVPDISLAHSSIPCQYWRIDLRSHQAHPYWQSILSCIYWSSTSNEEKKRLKSVKGPPLPAAQGRSQARGMIVPTKRWQ